MRLSRFGIFPVQTRDLGRTGNRSAVASYLRHAPHHRKRVEIKSTNVASSGLFKPFAEKRTKDVKTNGLVGLAAEKPIIKSPAANVDNLETTKLTLESDSFLLERMVPDGSIPTLNYGLERALFNPGVHWLRDLRSNVYNFDPFLRNLPRPEEFNFKVIPNFIPASEDSGLLQMAEKQGCSFITSTSSISQSMSSIYFVLNRMKPLNLELLSQPFADEPKTYTMLTRSPSAVFLKPHGPNVRSIVIEKPDEPYSVLSQLGQVMERLLTEPKENFLKMLKASSMSPHIRPSESYAYAKAGKILMRSQLDCHDPRLPLKTFDLKTRAALPIRMDVQNYQKYRNYRLISNDGLYCSFEREYYDMCRSAFLKYKYISVGAVVFDHVISFQVRIGDMDGVFVAYHNAHEIFGFQYISKEEMDERIYGNSITGDSAFNLILQIYNTILDTIVPLYSSQHIIKLTFLTDKMGSKLIVFAEDCGVDGMNNGKEIKQFTVNVVSLLNGFRTEQVLLNPSGSDKWKINCSISQVQPNVAEYDSARSKVTLKNAADEDRGANFMRIINEKSSYSNRGVGQISGPDIIAPWATLY